ncbi:MAG: FAD-dependent oxidoreductase [Verrucomicrobiota bacterium]
MSKFPKRGFILVVGGGSGGVAAALAAARREIPVVLVEPHALGGNSTAAGVNTWEPAIGGPGFACEFFRSLLKYPDAVALSRTSKTWTQEEPWSRSIVYSDPDGDETGYYKSLRRSGVDHRDLVRVTFEPDQLSRVMEDALAATGHVRLMRGWKFVSCVTAGRKITRVVVSDGKQNIELEPSMVIDSTAQIHLAASAGCKTALGAESHDLYGEPSAPATTGEQINGVTLCFRVRKRDTDAVDALPPGITGDPYPSNYSITEYPNGDLNINTLPLMEGIEYRRMAPADARAELESRLHRTWLWLQGEKGFGGYEIATVFPSVGVREGPRLVGRHVLTETEVRKGCSNQGNAETWIGLADHALDIHGKGSLCRELDEPYGVPYHCLLPREFDNLAVACRGASFSHIAGSSCRLSRTMSDLGHAAGIAAALGMGAKGGFPDVGVPEIQKELARDNVSLDPDDKRFAARPEHARRIV